MIGSADIVKAVSDVSFEIHAGETLGLVGETGSGKTTVGRCILRLIEPTSGRIVFRGQEVSGISQREFRRLRDRMQMVFQEPYDALNPRMKIGAIVAEPLVLQGKLNSVQRRQRVLELLRMVLLGEEMLGRYPHQVSAGEAQRVGIARSMATNPDLIIFDEPTSGLDISIRADIMDLSLIHI